MQENCETQCLFYAECLSASTEDPKGREKAFRQMMPTEGMRSEDEIDEAKRLVVVAEGCKSENPGASRDCRIISSIILKSAIG